PRASRLSQNHRCRFFLARLAAPQPLPPESRSPQPSQAAQPEPDLILHLPSLQSFLWPHFCPRAGTVAGQGRVAFLARAAPIEDRPARRLQRNPAAQAESTLWPCSPEAPDAPARSRFAATPPHSTTRWPFALGPSRSFRAPMAVPS